METVLGAVRLAEPLVPPSTSLPEASVSITRFTWNAPLLRYSTPLYFTEFRLLFVKPTVTPVWAATGPKLNTKSAMAGQTARTHDRRMSRIFLRKRQRRGKFES